MIEVKVEGRRVVACGRLVALSSGGDSCPDEVGLRGIYMLSSDVGCRDLAIVQGLRLI